MKKFAIMFVMLLGSVATMQAQSFNFSCLSTETTPFEQTHIPPGFTQVQANLLFALGFETHSDFSFFQHPDPIGAAELVVRSFGSAYEVDDEQGGDEFSTLQNATFEEAIVYVVSLLGVGYNDIRGIRLSENGIDIATSYENPYEAAIGTSIDFNIRAFTNLEDGILPLDVVFSLPATGHRLHNDNVSINGDIITVVFNESSVFQIRVYASSELTGQGGTDVFLTESFRGTN